MAKRCVGCMKMKENSPICEHCGYNEDIPNENHQLPVGTVLQGRYQVGKVLGQGGFGITYIGWDTALETAIAIKEYYPSSLVYRESTQNLTVTCTGSNASDLYAQNLDRFLREARILAKLQNVPGIVRVQNLFTDNNTAYIIMEYVDGINLKQYIRMQQRVLTVAETLAVMQPVMRALNKVHEAELVHRDISPDNIMIQKDSRVKLLDFGAARQVEHADVNHDLTHSTQTILKHGFAPIEQYRSRGNLGPWTDIYALCATMYYCLTGKVPSEAPERIMGDDNVDWKQVPGLTEPQIAALEQGMAMLPEKRVRSVQELYEVLYNRTATEYSTSRSRVRSESQPKTKPKPEPVVKDYPVGTLALEEGPEVTEAPKEEPAPKEEFTPSTPAIIETHQKKKKKPLRLIAAVVLIVVAVVGMFAAKANDPSPITNNDPPPIINDSVTLHTIACQYGTQTEDWWENFEEYFEKSNPNIDLVVDVVSWTDIYTVVNTSISNGEAPDLLNIDVFADYQADGLLLPASEWISEETYAKFFPSFLDTSVVDDVVWAVPDLASARALYYNADILAAAGVEVPTTWDELRSVCEAIKAYDPSISPWGVDMTTDEGQACFAYYAWNNGGGFVDEEGNWTLNSPENVEAVEFIVGMVKDGLTNPDPTTETRYDLQEMFTAGKVAMMISPNYMSDNLSRYDCNVNWAIAPIPTNVNSSFSPGAMDYFICFNNAYTEDELAAVMLFFDYFYTDERYADWVMMEGFLPVTSSGCTAMAAMYPNNAMWKEIVGSTKFYPIKKAEWADVRQGVIRVQQEALFGGNIQELLNQLQSLIAG